MRQGEPPARPATFEDLHAAHAACVRIILWTRGVRGAAERDEVAQEVWLDVHRGLEKFDPSQGTERAWIAGIARNAARDWHRTRRRRPEQANPAEPEPLDPREMTTETEREQQRAAVLAYFCRIVPNEEQREAFVLFEVVGLTVAEIAKDTGVRVWTAQWRLKMARIKVKQAQEALTDEEREKLRAVPIVGMGALVEALRSSVSDEELSREWDRLSTRIALDGGSTDAPVGTPALQPAPVAPPGFLLTGGQLAAGIAGVFLAGALAGAGSLYAYLSRDKAAATMIMTETPAPPVSTSERAPEPTPTASTAPTATTAVTSAAAAASTWDSESLLNRARNTLRNEPATALALANEHAQRFRGVKADEREEIAVRALLQLGRRGEAEERAAKLVRWAPSMRPTMDALLGR